jgi:hypothetical protein
MIAVDAPGAATGDFLDRNARNAPSRVERRRTSTTEGSFHTVWRVFERCVPEVLSVALPLEAGCPDWQGTMSEELYCLASYVIISFITSI